MTSKLCVLHDRRGEDEPDYLPALSKVENLVALRWCDDGRPEMIVEHPWLIDFTEFDRSKETFLHLSLTRRGGAPRLLVADPGRDDRLLARVNGLGTAKIVFRPVDVASIRRHLRLDRVSGRDFAPRAAISPTPGMMAMAGAAAVLEGLFEACVAGRPIDERLLEDMATAVLPAMREIGLDTWFEVVRDHHAGTYQHSLITMGIAAGFGRALDLREEDVQRLTLAGLVHDIGKFWVPEEILSKPGKLSVEEFAIVRRHCRDGWAVLRASGLPLGEDILDAILHHHEFLDGSGYPDGLRGEDISMLTRVLTIADIYGALAENRSYRSALKPAEILQILEAMADRGRIDATLLQALPLIRTA